MITKEQFEEIVLDRRSIYPVQFDVDKKIDDGVVERLLEMATWAPTHRITEPWRFIVFSGDGIDHYFEGLKSIYKNMTAEPDQKKLDKYDAKKEQVSHIVAIIMTRDLEERVPEIEEVAAVSCAAQNIYLGLKPNGIAGYWSTGDICFAPQMNVFLELEDNEKCLGFFNLGIPKADLPAGNRKRKPITSKLKWVRS